MNKEDLKLNRVYCSKRPKKVGVYQDLYDDRQVFYLSETLVQYDSPTVRNGRKYPFTTIEKFLKWADKDVTDECPDHEWRKVK